MVKVKTLILKADGTNCDVETKHAFELAGAEADIIHINSFRKRRDPALDKQVYLHDYHILAIPGGFSSGDYISAGKILANSLREEFAHYINEFVDAGKPIIGICNGFQVLVKSGLLPTGNIYEEPSVSLAHNDNGRFVAINTSLVRPDSYADQCIWTKGIESIDLYAAHGEGKLVTDCHGISNLRSGGQIVFQYANNIGMPTNAEPFSPNGGLVAAICDPSGLIFGIMPHPERSLTPQNHPKYALRSVLSRPYIDQSAPGVEDRVKLAGPSETEGAGLQIFQNGVKYARENLL
tara:strand:- start:6655 stop:7533 length:879 start_codon:yes stop_codon:yes gene_type:complete